MKSVSIIIPHYENWDMLYELLETIPSIKEIEVIVVDDNSTDSTIEILNLEKRFPDVQVLVNNSGNKGAGSSRNLGLKQATGEWLLFADSDDKFDPGFYNIIKPYLLSEFDIVYFSPSSFSNTYENVSKRHMRYSRYVREYEEDSQNEVNNLNLRYKFIVPWSKLIRSSVVKTNNILFEEIKVSNDILFSAKLGYHANKIYASNETIYFVREREGSLTTTFDENRFIIRFNAWKNYAYYLRSKLSSSDFKKLNLNSFSFLIISFKKHLSFSIKWYIIKSSKKNKIPIIDNRMFNIKKLYKTFLSR